MYDYQLKYRISWKWRWIQWTRICQWDILLRLLAIAIINCGAKMGRATRDRHSCFQGNSQEGTANRRQRAVREDIRWRRTWTPWLNTNPIAHSLSHCLVALFLQTSKGSTGRGSMVLTWLTRAGQYTNIYCLYVSICVIISWDVLILCECESWSLIKSQF